MTGRAQESPDLLIWLAAGVVACMALAWLVIAAPWTADDAPAGLAAPERAPVEPAGTSAGTAAAPAGRDPLYLARLALEAGMLVEPADYSAWSLFGEAAAADPGNPAARAGLAEVAAALIGRGRAALEQGRYADAEAIAATIFERLPAHEGAQTLAADIATARTPPAPAALPEPAEPAASVAEPAEPEPEPVDPVPGLHESFLDAMARNAILTPPGESASDIVGAMLAADPAHELTIDARDMLVTEMLDRSAQSIEALDSAAARTWIDSAAELAADPRRIEAAEARLADHLVAQEAQKLVPASALTQLDFAAPEYPEVALLRGIEGWVEIGFIVAPDGNTEEVTVLEASHERFFDDAALAAVREWRFEPVRFMGRTIRRRAFTRLEFVLD